MDLPRQGVALFRGSGCLDRGSSLEPKSLRPSDSSNSDTQGLRIAGTCLLFWEIQKSRDFAAACDDQIIISNPNLLDMIRAQSCRTDIKIDDTKEVLGQKYKSHTATDSHQKTHLKVEQHCPHDSSRRDTNRLEGLASRLGAFWTGHANIDPPLALPPPVCRLTGRVSPAQTGRREDRNT